METKLNAIEQKYQEKGELVNFDELLNVVYEEIVKIPKENVNDGGCNSKMIFVQALMVELGVID